MMLPTLYQFESNSNIKSILIFDNTQGEFKSYSTKVKIYNEENLFVNLAWNKGMELCETEYFLIINDDIVCSSEVVTSCIKILDENKDVGLVTVETKNIKNASEIDFKMYFQKKIDPEFSELDLNDHFGWFFASRTPLWKPISKDLKIFFGDDLLYDRVRHLKYKIACLKNYEIYHKMSTTVNSAPTKNKPFDGREQLKYELPFYNKYKNEFVRK
jgi:GT2 family glycosyltransferase